MSMLRLAGGGMLALAAVLVAVPVNAQVAAQDPTPADTFVAPAAQQLKASDIVFTAGAKSGQLTITSKSGEPLSVVRATASRDGNVRTRRAGTDFSLPSTWQRLGFGDICWTTYPPPADTFVLPEPVLPFTGPPGTWRFSNVIVPTSNGPVVYNRPRPNEYVTANGAEIESVIVCVTAAQRAAQVRRDLADTTNADTVTICHATNDVDNPYNELTVAVNAVANSGHLQHDGPLYPQSGWGDVIPPVEGVTPGLNWPAGQGLWENGCEPVEPPIDPWPPIEPPEPPVKPEPPIIVVPPPLQPIQPPIATVSPSASPSTSATPSATPSQPIGSITPTPSATPTSTPTGTPTGSATSTPTPSGTPDATSSPAPSTSPPGTSRPSGRPTTGPVNPGKILDRYCTSKDSTILPDSIRKSVVKVVLTNGVSTVTVKRKYRDLYCDAVVQPGSVEGGVAVLSPSSKHVVAGGLSLAGLALLLLPALRRRG